MAISTYSELLTAIDNWTKRSDLTARNPEFVVIGEARIGREVKARQMEARVSTTPDDQYVDLPSDYVSMRAVRIKGSEIGWLHYITPDKFFSEFASSETSSRKVYTIFGDELIFPMTPGGDVELWYYKKLTALSSSVNSLFVSNPDLYLYAAMAAAQPFMKNLAQMPVWENLYADVRDSINKQMHEGRYTPGMAVSVGGGIA
jgi:hypothetical protein